MADDREIEDKFWDALKDSPSSCSASKAPATARRSR